MIFKIDVRNAFNELSRIAIRKFLIKHLKFWPNFLIQQYSIDAEVDFGNEIRTEMKTGTQQGCKTSAHLFDAVVHTHLKESKLFSDFADCQINALHDDTAFRAPIARALPLFRRIVELYGELGLVVNNDKTEVLVRGDLEDNGYRRSLAGVMEITDKIRSDGMVFGGIPFGYDRYVENFVESKVEEYENLASKMMENSTGLNVGSVFSMARFCLSAKWPYLMRALPHVWNQSYKDSTYAKHIDSITLRLILKHMDITQFRQELTQVERDSLHVKLGLRLKNGGLGLHAVHDYSDAAMLGMWASNVDQIISSLGVLTDDEKTILSESDTIERVSQMASTMSKKFAHRQAFSKKQAADIGLNTGDISTMDILTKLKEHAALAKVDSVYLKGGKHQGKLRTATNLYKANRLTDGMAGKHANNAGRKADPYLRADIAQRSPIANRWLNRMHLDKNARLLTSAQVKVAFWLTVGINLKVENNDCKHCKVGSVNWFEHGQTCEKSRKRKQLDNKIKYFKRSWPLHKHIERLLAECFTKVPDVAVSESNPKILDTFPSNPENPYVPRRRNQVEILNEGEEEEPARGADGRVIAQPRCSRLDDGCEYGDLKLNVTFPGEIPKGVIIDVTVLGTHAVSNHRHTINDDKYSSGLADHGTHLKDLKHSRYLHDGNAIGFAMDSMGGISKAAMDFTNYIYAKGPADNLRRWDSEKMRVVLKKQFLDRLSSILCYHRVLDFTYLGIPNARVDQALRARVRGNNAPPAQPLVALAAQPASPVQPPAPHSPIPAVMPLGIEERFQILAVR
jgi:hypothetical protein